MRINLAKQLTLFTSLLLLSVWQISKPALAQTLPPDSLPSPTEPALPPVEPIEPETLPPVQDAPLDIQPGLSEPTQSDLENSDNCLPLASTEEARFAVSDIEVVGNTVLQSEIDQKVACYEGKTITLSDLFNLRSQITQLYIENGYITSGAFLPNNQVIDEDIEVQVIEGSIEEIQVNGLSRLRDGYVLARLSGAATPLNQDSLRESLQLLQLDANIQEVNAELTAGSQPGQSLLILDLSEPSSFGLFTTANNDRSPSIGETGANLSANYRNLLGIGDVLSASYGLTEGLDLYDVNLSLPLNAADGTLRIGYSNSDSRIVEDQFRDVGIRSDTQTVSVGFRQPISRTPTEEFALGLDFDWRRSQSFILDNEPFSFSEGPENGRSQVSALRFSQDWTKRDALRVLAARSQLNLGLDIFGATSNDTSTDGQFFSWLGQFQWVEQLPAGPLSLIKFNAQLTPDSLLPIERFSLGGISTVRGYTQNELVTDNALNASAELRIPLTRRNPNRLQIAPFIDAGYGWNNITPTPGTNFLLGTGAGLRWQAVPSLLLRVDYGVPIVNAGDRGGSLQENGVYFSITYQPN